MHRRTSTIEPRSTFQLQLDRHYFEIYIFSGVIKIHHTKFAFHFKVGRDEPGIGFVDDCGW